MRLLLLCFLDPPHYLLEALFISINGICIVLLRVPRERVPRQDTACLLGRNRVLNDISLNYKLATSQ